MTKETKNRFTQGSRLLVMTLLLASSNQTASFAASHPHSYRQEISLSDEYTVEVISQSNNSLDTAEQYHIKVYTKNTPKLISAMSRPMVGQITEVVVEDINNDDQADVVVMMESSSANNKRYLMIDTFSFNGKNMVWKQQLPKGLISVKTNSYLKQHEIPNELPRKTATVLLN